MVLHLSKRSIPLVALATSLTLAPACTCSGTRDNASSTATDAATSANSAALVSLPNADIDMKCPDALVAARAGGTDADRYVVPTEGERNAMRTAVTALVSGGRAAREAASTTLATIDFQIDDVPGIPDGVLLREKDDKKRGGGVYVLRLDSTSSTIVQTPHTFYDSGTLQLGCELFARARARALFVETAHRYKAAESTEEGDHPADVAHQPASLYQAVTEGFFAAKGDAGSSVVRSVIQLHGFSLRKPGEVVVVSNGTKQPGDPLVDRAQAALAPVLKAGKVARYPEDTQELGATTNVQGSLVRQNGARFLHVEMESRLRKDLLIIPDYRGRFLGALAAVLETP